MLGYHNIVANDAKGSGDASLHLSVEEFKRQLDWLQDEFEIVSLGQLARQPRDGHPRAAITFDDAYRGALELGVPELLERGLPSTIFVCPGFLDKGPFWWDLLADPSTGQVPGPLRQRALFELGGRHHLIMRWAQDRGLTFHPTPDSHLPATEKELLQAADSPLVTLGSHTWSHVHLPAVPVAEAQEELKSAGEWIVEKTGEFPSAVSFPYGGTSTDAERSVAEAGHDWAFLIEGGPFNPKKGHGFPHRLPRICVPRNLTLQGFMLRVRGAWPS